MFYLVSVLLGLMSTVMTTMNGSLASRFGVYSATVIIHVLGFLTVSAVFFIKRERFGKRLPFWNYLGGSIGFLTVIISNMAFGRISVSAILALGLFGQSLASLLFDQYGLFHMPRNPFCAKKLYGIALVLSGIVFMLWNTQISAIVPVVCSFLSGGIVVLSRTMNAHLARCTSSLQSTFFNFLSGFIVAFAAFLLLGADEPLRTHPAVFPQVWMYLGGVMAVLYVIMLNIAVSRVPSFYLTLLMFCGQVFSGIAADILLTGAFSLGNLIGGALVTAGLAQNLLVQKRGLKPCEGEV